MVNSQWMNSASDWLSEQQWYQELKGKWEELDPQSRLYLKVAVLATTVLLVLYLLISTMWSVRNLRNELSEKNELLGTITAASDEFNRLRETNSGIAQSAGDEAGPWNTYIESTAGTAGIDKASLAIANEKPGATSDTTKETLMDVSLKKVNIRQVVRYAFSLENGTRPVKVRNLSIDTHADPAGYMDATLSVSAFNVVTPK